MGISWAKWGIFCLLSFRLALGDELPDVPATAAPPAEASENEMGSSWVPIVGYDPTYKVFFGGGYFFESPKVFFGTEGVATFENVFQIKPHLRWDFAQRWSFGWEYEYAKGYEQYYGEGGETRVSDGVKILGDKMLTQPSLSYQLTPYIQVGFYFDIRHRWEDHVQGQARRAFPSETAAGLGVFQKVDKRDNKNNPRSGYIVDASLLHVPSGMVRLENFNSFSQAEAHLAIYEETLDGVVVAVKLSAGYTMGTPTYLFKYRLGGNVLLRGYLDNRFRGKKYYLQQTEVRFPIWNFVDGAFFVGFGDASDGAFTAAKMAYGFGVRLGIPPDYVHKARIDIGFGRDQSGIIITFGLPF